MHGNREKIERHEEINTNSGTIEMVENTKSGAEEKIKLTNQRQSKLKPIGIRVISQEP